MTTADTTPPDPELLRKQRAYPSLDRLATRHGATAEQRARAWHPEVMSPLEAVRLTAALGGGALPLSAGEEPVDVDDLLAALTLSAHARGDLDAAEAALIDLARGRGVSWAHIGFALGLRSAQAAQKRYARVCGGEDRL